MGTRKFFLGMMAIQALAIIAYAIFVHRAKEIGLQFEPGVIRLIDPNGQRSFFLLFGLVIAMVVAMCAAVYLPIMGKVNLKVRWSVAAALTVEATIWICFLTVTDPTLMITIMLASCFMLRQIGDLPKNELERVR